MIPPVNRHVSEGGPVQRIASCAAPEPRVRSGRVHACARRILPRSNHMTTSSCSALMSCSGSMAFRLYEMHRRTEPNTGRRGSRTVAKERLYQFIREQICQIRPRFNAGALPTSPNRIKPGGSYRTLTGDSYQSSTASLANARKRAKKEAPHDLRGPDDGRRASVIAGLSPIIQPSAAMSRWLLLIYARAPR